MKIIVVSQQDYPVSWADFGRRQDFEKYSDQDMLYVFSRNHHDEDDSFSEEAKNDIIGLSSINLPKDDYKLVKDFSNFYNCSGNQKISYFKDMKVHPGQISFFELSENPNQYHLATSNGNYEKIFLWDLDQNFPIQNNIDASFSKASYEILSEDYFYFENIKWSKNSNILYASQKTVENSNKERCIFSQHNFNIFNQGNQIQSKQTTLELKICPQQFIMWNNETAIVGTNKNKKFIIDIKDPKNIKYFYQCDLNSKEDTQIILEQNNKEEVLFIDTDNFLMELFDLRNVTQQGKPDTLAIQI